MSEFGKKPSSAEVILHNEGEAVTVRDVPVAVMQALYHEITGKTETLSKRYEKNFLFGINDIRQLIYKIDQTLEQFEVRGRSIAITIRHKDEETLRYSSTDRFFQYDTSRTEPIKEIEIKYDFLLSVPTVGKFHQYKLEIALESRVLDKKSPEDTYYLGYKFGQTPLLIQIEFIDYVVARTFMSAISEWENGLATSQVPTNKFLKKWGNDVGYFAPFLLAISSLAVTVPLASTFGPKTFDGRLFWYWMWGIYAAIFLLGSIGESLIGRWKDFGETFGRFPLILINRGDERNKKAFEEQCRDKPRKAAIVVGTYLAAFLINVIAGIALKVFGF